MQHNVHFPCNHTLISRHVGTVHKSTADIHGACGLILKDMKYENIFEIGI